MNVRVNGRRTARCSPEHDWRGQGRHEVEVRRESQGLTLESLYDTDTSAKGPLPQQPPGCPSDHHGVSVATTVPTAGTA